MEFQFEVIIGDRYESVDRLNDDEIYNYLMIINVRTVHNDMHTD